MAEKILPNQAFKTASVSKPNHRVVEHSSRGSDQRESSSQDSAGREDQTRGGTTRENSFRDNTTRENSFRDTRPIRSVKTQHVEAKKNVWSRLVDSARQVIGKDQQQIGLADERINALERSILNGNLKVREERSKRERSGTAEFVRQEDGIISERKPSPRPAAYYRRG